MSPRDVICSKCLLYDGESTDSGVTYSGRAALAAFVALSVYCGKTPLLPGTSAFPTSGSLCDNFAEAGEYSEKNKPQMDTLKRTSLCFEVRL